MEFTGERFLPELNGMIALEHWHRYLLARELAQGKQVLDIACGEGYGSALLAGSAERVVGVDISEEAVGHARATYALPNLTFRQGDCANIPLEDASVDMVVSFETLEHHTQHHEMMREVRRVLKPGGVLMISTPDRLEYSDIPNYSNEYHVKELYYAEFEALLREYFANIEIYQQRVVYGSVIFGRNPGMAAAFDGKAVEQRAQPGLLHAPYLIALVSDEVLPVAPHSVMEVPVAEVLGAQLGEWEAKVQKVSELNVRQRQQLDQQQELIHRLHTSLSWRLTAPLRAIARLFKS